MAYEIRYDQLSMKTYSGVKLRKKLSKRAVYAMIACLLVCMACLLWKSDDFRRAIIPGNMEVTQAAWNDFVEDVQSGVPIIDAVTTFCRGVIYGEAPRVTGA